jgi:FkbM family methyltransferase
VSVEYGDIVVDIGANIGEFTIAISPLAERVIAIEPDPNVQEALAENLQHVSNASMFQTALSDKDGEAEFFLSTKDADSSLMRPETFSEKVKVRVSSLDTFIRETGIKRIDFLKIEAEGWEPEILSGASRALAITRKVAVDAGPEREGAPTTEAVAKSLTDAGFQVSRCGYIVLAERSERGA